MISASIEKYMSRDFVRITQDMPVVEATSKLIQKPLLGGPVVDTEGKLQGWISEQECLHVYIQVLYHNQRVTTVSEIMRKDVLTVSPDSDLLSLATQMLDEKPKSYPVISDNGQVLGVITRRQVLQILDEEMTSQASKR